MAAPGRHEARWPTILATLAVIAVITALPDRMRIAPSWFTWVVGSATAAAMLGVSMAANDGPWLRLERFLVIGSFAVTKPFMLITLWQLVHAMLDKSHPIDGLWLLSSSVGIWLVNVSMYSLLYWQLDRGGPEARVAHRAIRPDWLFAQSGAGDAAPAGWEPKFVDYLFLSFTTATAFSPTDALPLTGRAKMLMMAESAFSLVTIVIVASRAINVLG